MPFIGDTMATILPPTDASVQQAARFLMSGGLVSLPTETVYGLAADATSEVAVAKIFAAKDRPATNPLIVHIEAAERVLDFAVPVDDSWQALAEAFWPGPLTLILPLRPGTIAPAVTAGKATLGLRVPDVAMTRAVIRQAGVPLAAPSANPAGYVSPTTAGHVQANLGQRIEYILDGGPCRAGIESTILDLSSPAQPRLLRPGPLSLAALESVLGTRITRVTAHGGLNEAQLAPGQFTAHYQPRARVRLWEGQVPQALDSHNDALVFFQKPGMPSDKSLFWLSDTGSVAEAARNLYGMLRALDEQGFATLWLERAPDTPLGEGINDRLQRAAATA